MRITTPACSVFVALFVSLVSGHRAGRTAMTVGPSKAAGKNVLWNGTFDGRRCAPGCRASIRPTAGGTPSRTTSSACRSTAPGPSAASVAVRQRPLALARGHHYQLRLCGRTPRKATRLRVRLSKIGAPYTELWAGTAEAAPDARTLHGDVRRSGRRGERRAGDRARRRAGRRRAVDRLPRRCGAQRSRRRSCRAERCIRAPSPRCASTRSAICRGCRRSRPCATGADAPLDWQLVDAAGKRARQRQDAPVRRRSLVGRAGAADRLLVGHGRRARAASCAWAAMRASPFAIGARHLPPLEVRRAGVLLPAAQRHPHQDALRRHAPRTSARPGTPATRASPARPRRPAATRSTPAAAGTTPATTASTSSTAASPSGCCRTSTRRCRASAPRRRDFGDGKMKIPESKNGRPDLLDEARFGARVLLAHAGVRRGSRRPGWCTTRSTARSGPASRPRPRRRRHQALPTAGQTAATLNLAAAAAQAARLWRKLDPAFSARCLTAAETAFAAAKANPHAAVRARDARAAAPTATASSTTSATGRPPSSSSPPASPTYRDELVRSRFHAPKEGAAVTARQHRLGPRRGAGQDRACWWRPTRSAKARWPNSAARSSPRPIACSASSSRAATGCRWRRTARTSGAPTAAC